MENYYIEEGALNKMKQTESSQTQFRGTAEKTESSKYQKEGGSGMVVREMTLQQLAEGLPRTLLSASDKDLEDFQKIMHESLKLREGHKHLQKMIQEFSRKGVITS